MLYLDYAIIFYLCLILHLFANCSDIQTIVRNWRLHDYLFLLGSLFLVSDCFLLTLTSAGVVFGALTTEGKAQTVTDAAIAADVHQSLDVHLDFGTEGALDLVLIVDDVTQGVLFVVGPILNLLVFVDAGFCQDL